MFSGCNEEDSVSPTEEDRLMHLVRSVGGGDWPSLKSPSFGDNVIIGAGIPTVTAEYKTDFYPTLTAVRGNDWFIKIIRPEAICTGHGILGKHTGQIGVMNYQDLPIISISTGHALIPTAH